MAAVAPTELELLARVAVATVCGMAVGIEREFSEKPAGLRTHTLVALGAACFTVAGFAALPYAGAGVGVDPSRIAAQVVNGIGFLGAGIVIFQGDRVQGLTTAAEMWAVAALGVLCGLGLWAVALLATLLILVIVVGGRPLETLIDRTRSRRHRRLARKTSATYELIDEDAEAAVPLPQ